MKILYMNLKLLFTITPNLYINLLNLFMKIMLLTNIKMFKKKIHRYISNQCRKLNMKTFLPELLANSDFFVSCSIDGRTSLISVLTILPSRVLLSILESGSPFPSLLISSTDEGSILTNLK